MNPYLEGNPQLSQHALDAKSGPTSKVINNSNNINSSNNKSAWSQQPSGLELQGSGGTKYLFITEFQYPEHQN